MKEGGDVGMKRMCITIFLMNQMNKCGYDSQCDCVALEPVYGGEGCGPCQHLGPGMQSIIDL